MLLPLAILLTAHCQIVSALRTVGGKIHAQTTHFSPIDEIKIIVFNNILGTHIPGELRPSEVPQMVILTFDDAINEDNFNLYEKTLFPDNRQNPNGCPIKATFYVSHQYNNYHQTQSLWNKGHEIGIHSIT